ncbi:MAG: SpoIIE family protein phosphatase [Oscillospiraceae bacterium]|nr:SpoIIE family protein phosphatase [Oscillospiraceae bacterium]
MQNKTDMVGISPLEHLRQFAGRKSALLGIFGAGLGGLILSQGVLFGSVAPFGVALVAALSGANAMGAALGAIAGYIVLHGPAFGIQYLAAILLVLAAGWLFAGRIKDEDRRPLFSALTCFLGLAISGGALLVLGDPTLFDVVVRVAEIFLGCGAAYFFGRSLLALGGGLLGANRAEVSCLIIAGCVVLMAFSPIVVVGLSVGRILGVLMILVAARHGREAGGAIAGISAGVAVALVSGDYSYVVGAYAFGGLAAGLFAQFGKIAGASAFIVINTGVSLLTMEVAGANAAIYEVFAASVLFMAIPGGVISRLAMRSLPASVGETDGQAVLRERLEDYAAALSEIGQTTREVSEKLCKLESPDPDEITRRVAARVCVGCGMSASCWQLRSETTLPAMREAITLLRKEGIISREKMPRHFLQGCCRLDELIRELSGQFIAYTARENVQRKVGKVRSVLIDQFEGIAQMLGELSDELSASRPLEPEKAGQIEAYFACLGLRIHRLSSTVDRYGRIKIELCIPGFQIGRLSKTKATLDLCAILETDFDLPEAVTREKLVTLTFCEKATYTVEVGGYQLTGGKSRLCGDAYDCIKNKGGQAHLILSDGMGSGGSAAVDSTMACDLLIKLVKVGVSYDAALKMVNSALLIKSGEESLATIDVCALDLFTGKANFFKAGAAPTFIIKGGKAGYLESASLPAGILHGVAFEKSSVTLHDGDTVVMVSDGVTGTGTDWVKSELGSLKDTGVQRLCEQLAITAKTRRTESRGDDITVVAAMLKK